MLSPSPPSSSSQVKVQQQWTRCLSFRSRAAPPSAARHLRPAPVAGRHVVSTVGPTAVRALAAETPPSVPQPPPLLFPDEESMLANYVPVFVMLPMLLNMAWQLGVVTLENELDDAAAWTA
ncbi:hypothetical protein PR202_ga29676 [Eleusine coracana subsp. coracana]|uniref:Uncharacterized protein n=1 Tax=Eleusine coracana subsp. coracana TaxID=191504 RepID=A0AAV5DLV1_ELECO|nr:hypothetical protein PR202_ga29676 [Eleusine coracana subsp. coracana]